MAEKQVSVRIKAEGAGQLKAEFQSIGAEAQRSFGQIDRGARGSGAGLQDVGFQVQDFAVQVAGGTDVSRAFAQQLPQLLSGLGLMGVLFGTVAAVAIPLFSAFGVGVDKAEALTDSVKALDAAMSSLNRATEAAKFDPVKMWGEFGAGSEQAREVLEIQRQIAAARAENALDQASGSIAAFLGNDAARIDAYRQKIKELQADLAAVRANPPLAADFDFSAAEADIAKLQGRLERMEAEVVDDLASSMDVTAAAASRIVEALGAVGEASGPRAQAEAMGVLRDALTDAAAESGNLSDEMLNVLQNLTDAELAALGLAAVDMASPIGAAAGEAARLADNLFNAVAAQRQFDRGNKTYGGRGGDPRQFMPGGPQAFTPSREVIKQADEMLNPRPARGGRGGGGGGGGVSQAEREAARVYDQTRTAAEKYAIELAKLNDLHKAGHLDTDTYNRAVEKLGKDLDKAGDLGKKAASAIRGAFDNLFDDPAAALNDFSKQLFQMALYAQLAKSFPSVFGSGGFVPLMNANGNVFEGGTVQAFAAGGIVSSATMFPMKGGAGVMGEAGPEAIMPLTRIGGKLGVAAAGGGGSNVSVAVHNYGGGEVEKRESRGPNGERQIDIMIGKSLASGRQDSALRSRYGTPPNPVKR